MDYHTTIKPGDKVAWDDGHDLYRGVVHDVHREPDGVLKSFYIINVQWIACLPFDGGFEWKDRTDVRASAVENEQCFFGAYLEENADAVVLRRVTEDVERANTRLIKAKRFVLQEQLKDW